MLYGLFRSKHVQTYIVGIVTEKLSEYMHADIEIKGVDIGFWDRVILEEVLLTDQKKDTVLFVPKLDASIHEFALRDKVLAIEKIRLRSPKISIKQEDALLNVQFLIDSIAKIEIDTLKPWNISLEKIRIQDGNFTYSNKNSTPKNDGLFDKNAILLRNFNLAISQTNNDSIKEYSLSNLSFNEQSGLQLDYLMADIKIDSTWVDVSNIRLNTPNSSIISPKIGFSYEHIGNKEQVKNIPFSFLFEPSTIGSKDLGYFVQKLQGPNLKLLLSGDLNGRLGSMHSKYLQLSISDKLAAKGNFSISGLPDFKRAFIFAQLDKASFDFQEITKLNLLNRFGLDQNNKLPTWLKQAGVFTYEGNFTGFPSDFVSYGTLKGSMGELSTDIAIRPNSIGDVSLDGRFITKGFNIGTLTQNKNLGRLTVHADLNGSRTKNGVYNAKIKGVIDSIEIKEITIKEIFANGTIKNKSFDGELYVNDPNLDLFFNGKADLDTVTPVFNFTAGVNHCNLTALGLDKKKEKSEVSLLLDANFEGAHLDSALGNVEIKHLNFVRDKRVLDIENILISTDKTDQNRSVKIRSSFLDLNMLGDFAFRSLPSSFNKLFQYYLPHAVISYDVKKKPREDQFTLDFNLKEVGVIMPFLSNNTRIEHPFHCNMEFDSNTKKVTIQTNPISILHNDIIAENIILKSNADGVNWSNSINISTFALNKNLELQNIGFFSDSKNDTINSVMSWNNNDTLSYSGRIGANIAFVAPTDSTIKSIQFEIPKSNIWLADSLWTLEIPKIHVDTTKVAITKFNLSHKEESLNIDGIISKNTKDSLYVDFENLHLIHINEITKKDLKLRGVIDGDLIIKDLYTDRILLTDMTLDSLAFRGQQVGNITLYSRWNQQLKNIEANLSLIHNKVIRAQITGSYTPTTKFLNFSSIFNELPLETLYPVLTSFANKTSGTVDGQIDLIGEISKPDLNGFADITNGEIGIAYTKVPYYLNDRIEFHNDSILFPEITIFDAENNRGTFDGYITHDLFQNLKYNLEIQTNYILGLQTTSEDSDLYYGTAHTAGEVKITGHGRSVRMDLSLRSENGTDIVIPLEGPAEAKTNDFIRFSSEIKKQQELEKEKNRKPNTPVEESGFELYLDLQIVPNANVQIIFDEAAGDGITGSGVGELRIAYDKDKNLTMFGGVNVEQGNYTFTLQNFINKKFRIERGSSISWNGDPYNAQLDINAIYSTRASLYDLFLDDPTKDYSRRIKVDAIIKLNGQMLKPNVSFAIDFPTADERTKDEVAQYLTTEDEINRQIISLLFMGQFYTPEFMRTDASLLGSNGDVVGNTTSELLSNQFSNWLSQISNDFDIGFNYRPGDDVSDREVEVALSTQFLNNRVTVNGNIGNNGSLQSNNSSDLIGEVEIYVKLTENGKLQLKAYNRSNDDLIYDTAPYTQGVGFTYREEFDSWDKLFIRYKENRIKRKKSQAAQKAKRKLEKSIAKSKKESTQSEVLNK